MQFTFDDRMDRYGIRIERALELLTPELIAKCRRTEYAVGEIISNSGDELTEIGFFESGVATGATCFPNGEQYEFFQLDASNGSIGLMEVFCLQRNITSTVAALTPTVILWLPLRYVYENLMTDLVTVRRYAFHLAIALLKNTAMTAMFYKSGAEKVRYYLANFCSGMMEPGGAVVIPDSYQHIANSLGISSKTVCRAIRELTDAGLIGRSGRNLQISYEQYREMSKGL